MDGITLIILIVCILGSTITSYLRGLSIGAEACLTILQDQKIISVDEDGEITPYK